MLNLAPPVIGDRPTWIVAAADDPFYWGYANEMGEGAGRGTTVNLPSPRSSDWSGYRPALEQGLEAIRAFGARFLVVSFGANTYAGDPISHFALLREDFAAMGRRIAATGLPILTVMEGGYATAARGAEPEDIAGVIASSPATMRASSPG